MRTSADMSLPVCFLMQEEVHKRIIMGVLRLRRGNLRLRGDLPLAVVQCAHPTRWQLQRAVVRQCIRDDVAIRTLACDAIFAELCGLREPF